MQINTHIIPYALPPLISSVYALILAIFILFKNPKSQLNTYFSGLMFVTFVWLSGFAAMNVMKYQEDAYLFSRIIYSGVVFLPAFYYGFVSSLGGFPARNLRIRLCFGASFVFLCFLWLTRSFLEGNIQYSWGFSSKAGWLHHVFLIFFFTVFLSSFLQLYRKYKIVKVSDPVLANKIKYVLIAFNIAIIASTDFLSVLGVDYYPLGFLFIILFSLITTYAIIKHNLLDLKVAIQKGALYSMSYGLISLVFVLSIVITEKLSQIYFGYSSIVFTFAALVLLSFVFLPLNNLFLSALNRLLFHASPDQLAETNVRLMQEMERQDHMRSVATLAAGMAHEIKNPLTTIKTFSEHLPQKKNDPQFMEKYSKVVTKEVGNIDKTVRELLEFSKPSPLTLEDLNIQSLLREVLTLLSGDLTKHKIKLKTDFLDDCPTIRGDKRQLEQVFVNIILNAIQAMPNGGTLTVKSELDRSNHLVISISDTGSGIPKDQLNRIFDPFFTTKDTGTGLGLSIVHQIVEKHKGRIKASSVATKGTRFSIILKAI